MSIYILEIIPHADLLLKTLFWGLGKGKSGRTPTKRAQQNGTFQVSAVLVEMARKGPKTSSQPF